MKEVRILVQSAEDLTPDEIVDGIQALRRSELLFLGCTVQFEVEAGREGGLSSDFPYPDLLDEVKRRLRKECIVIAAYIHSWQDARHEDQQAAWRLSFAW